MRNARNDWLRERIKDLGKTGQGLANALGVNKARVSEIIGGRRGVKAEEVSTIAMYLEMTEQEVIARLSGRHARGGLGEGVAGVGVAGLGEGGLGEGGQPSRFVAPAARGPMAGIPVSGPLAPGGLAGGLAAGAAAPRTVEVPAPAAMPLDLPVFGTAVGGQDADFEMNGEVIDRVRRPPGLAAARNAFALYVVGTSMSPRYDEGDLIFIHPGKPPVPGCDVVVELNALDEFGRHKALLKTYRGKTPTRLLLAQFNPEGPLELALTEVKQVYRVMRTHELLGL